MLNNEQVAPKFWIELRVSTEFKHISIIKTMRIVYNTYTSADVCYENIGSH